MATLNVKVTTQKMPHTSEFFAVVKAIEHFYYALLLATDPEYKGNSKPWSTWADIGFSAAIRQASPGIRPEDRLQMSVYSNGKSTEITATSPRSDVIETLGSFLGQSDVAKAAVGSVVAPVTKVLRSDGLHSEDIGAFEEMLKKGVEALTYRDITKIEAKVS